MKLVYHSVILVEVRNGLRIERYLSVKPTDYRKNVQYEAPNPVALSAQPKKNPVAEVSIKIGCWRRI